MSWRPGTSRSPRVTWRGAHVTTGAVTGVPNRLERGGFVTRQPDPTDGRRVRVVAVPAAAERVREIYGPFYERLAALFDRYPSEEIALLADWFTRAGEEALAYLERSRRGAGGGMPRRRAGAGPRSPWPSQRRTRSIRYVRFWEPSSLVTVTTADVRPVLSTTTAAYGSRVVAVTAARFGLAVATR